MKPTGPTRSHHKERALENKQQKQEDMLRTAMLHARNTKTSVQVEADWSTPNWSSSRRRHGQRVTCKDKTESHFTFSETAQVIPRLVMFVSIVHKAPPRDQVMPRTRTKLCLLSLCCRKRSLYHTNRTTLYGHLPPQSWCCVAHAVAQERWTTGTRNRRTANATLDDVPLVHIAENRFAHDDALIHGVSGTIEYTYGKWSGEHQKKFFCSRGQVVHQMCRSSGDARKRFFKNDAEGSCGYLLVAVTLVVMSHARNGATKRHQSALQEQLRALLAGLRFGGGYGYQ